MSTLARGDALARPAERLVVARRRRPLPWGSLAVHGLLLAAVAVIAFPLYYAFVISTQEVSEVIQKPPRLLPSVHFVENYYEAWQRSGMARLLVNSTIVAVGVAVGKISISILSAFAIVYFRFRGRQLVFWMIFITLMLPIPVRILPTYEVIGDLG